MDRFEKFKGKGLSGLTNCGNTCYMNSCMQVFSHMYELNGFLDQGTYNKRLTQTPDSVLLTQWDALRKLMWNSNCIIAPNAFVKAVHRVAAAKKRPMFMGHAQNDVQEYLLFLIDCFHTALSREVVMEVTGSAENERDVLAKSCYEMMVNMYKKEYSEMIGMFFGIQVSEIKSASGDVLSVCPEPVAVISLPVETARESTLAASLGAYCSVERMEGDNAFFNEKTGKKEDVTKELGFWSLPTILIIDLKRWNMRGQKNNALVDFPMEGLDMSPYVRGYNKDSYVYDLFGVCNHSGGPMGGHYTASVRAADGDWYGFNDAQVSKIQAAQVKSPRAYCLFYRKIK